MRTRLFRNHSKFGPVPIALLIAVVAIGISIPTFAVGQVGAGAGHVAKKKKKTSKHSDAAQDLALFRSHKAELKGGIGAAGARGAAGAAGAAGATGAQGPAGRSALTPLQSGETIRGIVGGRFQNGSTAASPMAATASFPIPASVPLDNAHTVVAPTAPCNTGSTTNVIAPAGFVCIYPDIVVSATNVSANTGVSGTRTLGFQMEWETTAANAQSSVRAEWAYTAP